MLISRRSLRLFQSLQSVLTADSCKSLSRGITKVAGRTIVQEDHSQPRHSRWICFCHESVDGVLVLLFSGYGKKFFNTLFGVASADFVHVSTLSDINSHCNQDYRGYNRDSSADPLQPLPSFPPSHTRNCAPDERQSSEEAQEEEPGHGLHVVHVADKAIGIPEIIDTVETRSGPKSKE